jgi:heterodisulfide reductase subunit A2
MRSRRLPPWTLRTARCAASAPRSAPRRPWIISRPPRQLVLRAQTAVVATGFGLSRVERKKEFGQGRIPNVIDALQMERLLAPHGPYQRVIRPSDGKEPESIAYIQYAGSRDKSLGVPYCSRACCMYAIKQAMLIAGALPLADVTIYYMDIRAFGKGYEQFFQNAMAMGIQFVKARIGRMQPAADHNVTLGYEAMEEDGRLVRRFPLRVEVKDTLTFGETVSAEADLVVLAVGMQASPIDDLVEMMKLPRGMDGFLQEVHPKLRPVEVANTGILLAGTCQAPMDIGEACAAAQAAAVKASALLAKGYIEMDPYVARVDAQSCNGEGRCAQVCPVEGAVSLAVGAEGGQAGRKAEINPALCTGCGICVAECPQQAIDINGWTLKQYEAMVDAILAA